MAERRNPWGNDPVPEPETGVDMYVVPNPPMGPEEMLNLGMVHMQDQYPKEHAGVRAVWKMPEWMQKMDPEMIGGVNPLTRVLLYNPTAVKNLGTQQDVDDFLAHELKHINQVQNTGTLELLQRIFANMLTPYENRPEEQEAYGHVAMRREKRQNIELPPDHPVKVRVRNGGK